ncbi:MAG: membrane protein YdbS with pleckstrin-like domain [Oceanicoccus sp.]|jgi:membrane protein YdbS with pleckstrin-like domain
MFSNYFYPKFLREEKLIEKIHKHWLAALPSGLWLTLIALIMIGTGFGFKISGLNSIVLAGVFSVLAIYIFKIWFQLRMNCFYITDKRLINIKQYGLFQRRVDEVPLDKIDQITYETKGILNSLFNIGTLRIKTASKDEEIFIKEIVHPHKYQTTILKLQREHQSYGVPSESPVNSGKMDMLVAMLAGSKANTDSNTNSNQKNQPQVEDIMKSIQPLWDFVLADYIDMKKDEKKGKKNSSEYGAIKIKKSEFEELMNKSKKAKTKIKKNADDLGDLGFLFNNI